MASKKGRKSSKGGKKVNRKLNQFKALIQAKIDSEE